MPSAESQIARRSVTIVPGLTGTCDSSHAEAACPSKPEPLRSASPLQFGYVPLTGLPEHAVKKLSLLTPMTFFLPLAVFSKAMFGDIGSPIGSGSGNISAAKTSLKTLHVYCGNSQLKNRKLNFMVFALVGTRMFMSSAAPSCGSPVVPHVPCLGKPVG